MIDGSLLALIIRLTALGVALWFVVRLMVRQAQVRNSLYRLRLLLLAEGVLVCIGNVLTSYFLVDIVLHQIPQKTLNVNLQITNALIFLGISLVGALIYHLSFTDENIEFHNKVADLEEKAKK